MYRYDQFPPELSPLLLIKSQDMISLSPLLCLHHEVVEGWGVTMIPRTMSMVAQVQSPMLDRSRDRGQMNAFTVCEMQTCYFVGRLGTVKG